MQMDSSKENCMKNANRLMTKDRDQVVYFILSKDQIQCPADKLQKHSVYFRETLSK